MKKVFLQDVVPSGKRSIRNIPLPNSKNSARIRETRDTRDPRETGDEREEVAPTTEKKTAKQTPPRRQKSGSGFRRLGFWAGVLVVLLIVGYFGSFLFVTADVKITPKEQTTPISVAGAASASPVGTELGFTIVSLSKEAQKELPATGQEKVEKKASGKIIIYNASGAESQKLIANTRFETASGLIYRIKDAVTVPGQKTVSGSVVPGSLTVTVYADQAGEKYNIGLSDFTIPGFKGDPRYTKITAKSDPTNPIKGGFVGTTAKVAPSDALTAKASIETELKSELKESLLAQVPASHVLLNNAYIFNFEELPQTPAAGAAAGSNTVTTAIAREKGTIYGILFDKDNITQFISQKTADVSGKDIAISNLNSLTFTLDNTASFTPSTKTISFKISGEPHFVWNIDEQAIAQSLIGQKRANIKGILSNFEAVDKANLVINPFWIMTLPSKAESIRIEVTEN